MLGPIIGIATLRYGIKRSRQVAQENRELYEEARDRAVREATAGHNLESYLASRHNAGLEAFKAGLRREGIGI